MTTIFHITHQDAKNLAPVTVGLATSKSFAIEIVVGALLTNGVKYDIEQFAIEEHMANVDLTNRSVLQTWKGQALKDLVAIS